MNVMLIKDIETRDVISLLPEAAFDEALAIMDDRKISFLVIIKDDKPVGVLTERDVVRLAARHKVTDQTLLQAVMTSPVYTVHEDSDIFEAYDLLTSRQIRHLVVMDAEGEVAGLLTQSDLLDNLGIEYFIDLKHVSSIMTRRLFTLTGKDPVQKAFDMMERERISCVVVVEDGRPAGIWTERDVTHFCHAHMDARTTLMREVMTAPVKTMPETAYVPEVNHFMQENRLRHVVIVDHDGRLAGLISQSNLTKGLEGRYVSFLKRMLKTRNATIQHDRKQHEALFELNPNVSFRLDAEGVIQDCNAASTLLTGYDTEAMTGKSMTQFIAPGDVSGFEQTLCRARENHPAHCECYIHPASGDSIAIFLSLIPVRAAGKGNQIYGIAHDITAHKQAEKALRVKLDEIERMNRLMIGRELKMEKMRREIKGLKNKLDQDVGTGRGNDAD